MKESIYKLTYLDYMEKNKNIINYDNIKSLMWLTICKITYGNKEFIATNTFEHHAEINALNKLINYININKTSINNIIKITIVRIRIENNKWKYYLCAPCKHCTKIIKFYSNKIFKKNIKCSWSIESDKLILTKPCLINNINIKDCTISKGWLYKISKYKS